jgi:hypothetical protein
MCNDLLVVKKRKVSNSFKINNAIGHPEILIWMAKRIDIMYSILKKIMK